MASTRRGESMGLTMGLVVFVVLFFLALVASVVIWTQLDGAMREKEKAIMDRDAWVTAREMSDPEISAAKASAKGQSVVKALVAENRELKQRITGDPQMKMEGIKNEIENIGIKAGNTVLITELKNQIAEAQAQKKLAEKSLAAQDDLARKMVVNEEARQAAEQKLLEAERQMKTQMTALGTQVKSFENVSGEERKRLEQRVAELQSRLQTDVTNARAELDSAKQDNQVLRSRLDEIFKDPANVTGGPDPVTLPDAQIIGVSSDQLQVYLNVGKKQHVSLGLTFNVYPTGKMIEKDEKGDLKAGKAIIEVVSLGETTSTARVLMTRPDASINEGDVVANVVYDPNQTYKFYVFGQFDIDHTGQATDADRKRVEMMINQWGGRVQDQLSYDTDFLVVGEEPIRPEPLSRDVRDPRVIEESAIRQRVWDEYKKLLADADRYQIKVLNTNRFLNLVAYYRR